jgi:lysophospholipase L1-like esterase
MKAVLKKSIKVLLELGIIVLICVLMLDGIVYFILRNPDSLPDNPLTRLVRLVNITAARTQPAFDPECSKYDEQVTYRYREGQCRHQSWEFDVTIKANSLGFPDDEASLIAPEIVVLGDSYTAGWGVEQHQAFPAVLEQLAGKKVLAAAAPSYGTARELLLLDRIDLSGVKTVIIQHSENDAFENMVAIRDKRLNPMPAWEYGIYKNMNLHVASYLKERYYPGKYIRLVKFTLTKPQQPPPPDQESQVEHFLGVVDKSLLVEMDGVKIIVISVNQEPKSDKVFIEALRKSLADPDAPEFHSRITTLKTRENLTRDDYFILDDHLRPSGHQKLAELLFQALQ